MGGPGDVPEPDHRGAQVEAYEVAVRDPVVADGDASPGLSVAELLRLCGGQPAVQQKSLGPDEQVDGCQGQLQPCGVNRKWREGSGQGRR